MNTSDTIKQKINDLNNQVKNLNTELQILFKKELEDLINKYKIPAHGFTLKNIMCRLNAYEFNDGDTPYWSLYHEDLTVNFEDELGNEVEIDGYGDNEKPEFRAIRKEFKDLFAQFDIGDFYEKLLEDEYESISFSVDKDGKLTY